MTGIGGIAIVLLVLVDYLLAWISTDQSWLTRLGAQAGSPQRK